MIPIEHVSLTVAPPDILNSLDTVHVEYEGTKFIHARIHTLIIENAKVLLLILKYDLNA